MRIRRGEKAPHFMVSDIHGNTIDLNNYDGSTTLISFFRGAACPFCNLRVHELIRHKDAFEKKGIKVILFFTGTRAQIMQYVGKQQAPYPIIPDPDLKIYRKFGVEQSFMGMLRAMLRLRALFTTMRKGFFSLRSMTDRNTLPADFLIDEEQRVLTPYYGKDFGDHLPIETILN